MTHRFLGVLAMVIVMLSGTVSLAQERKPAEEPSKWRDGAQKAGRIASQPARDVGAMEDDIPPVLLMAQEAPYSLKSTGSCAEVVIGLRNLNEVLGPDYSVVKGKKENKAGKLAEAGGQTVVNSLIPFRGLVREVTGAAPAQRRYNAAVAAGVARRGFLRGLYTGRKCRTPI